MRPQRQLIKHDPENGQWGDCHRTCIAMVLNMDAADVPNFGEGPKTDQDFCAASNEWLMQHGLREATIAYPGDGVALADVIGWMPADVPFILGCTSSNGFNHSVVVFAGEVFNPNDSTIAGPMDNGQWQVTFLAAMDWRPT